MLLAITLGCLCSPAPARSGEGTAEPAGALPRHAQSVTFLKSLPREWAGSSRTDCRTYEDKNVERLQPEFSAAAARFLEAFVSMHGVATITSAHRSVQEQACVCDGERGPCAGRTYMVRGKKGRRIMRKGRPSKHQDGIALDVRPGTGSNEEFRCLHEFARLNPHFGVWFPLGFRDRPHMEPMPRTAGPQVRVAALGGIPPTVAACTAMRSMLTDVPVD